VLRKNRFSSFIVIVALAIAAPLASCRRDPPPAEAKQEKAAQRTFASPTDAGEALLAAARSGDRTAFVAIFGPDVETVLFTSDAASDKESLADFVTAYERMHRWGRITAGGETLYVGANNYAFPIPLDRDAAGRWSFDTAAGRDELLARRIGNNELAAIAALGGIAEAQQQYVGRPRDGSKGKEYAGRFVSAPGPQDGLYWPASAGTTSPLASLASLADLAQAAGKGDEGGTPEPFSGYAFRILTKQGNTAKSGAKDYVVGGRMAGGFAVVAYPVDYRTSGLMTFMIGTDGIVYQKDLGEKTTDIGSTMTEYNPSDGWAPVITGEQR
jgi:hypothetical protein